MTRSRTILNVNQFWRHPSARFFLVSASLLLSWSAQATDENWTETVVAPPAFFSTSGLLPLEISPGSAMRFGIDPTTLSIGTDRVVRYVLVAQSASGALNVLYEGIRCETAEMKTYARWNNDSSWNVSQDASWRTLQSKGSARHGMVLATQGVCEGTTPNKSVSQILKSLQTGRAVVR